MNTLIKSNWIEMRTIVSASGLTQQQLSNASGVSQAAVSRLLASCPIRNGAAFKRLCNYAFNKKKTIQLKKRTRPEHVALVSAIQEVWNGTPAHAHALAEIIRAAGAVTRASAI